MYSFGIIMDPIEDINPKEDSTFSIITALQKNHNIEYIMPDTIHLINQDVFAKTKKLKTFNIQQRFVALEHLIQVMKEKKRSLYNPIRTINDPIHERNIVIIRLIHHIKINETKILRN